jgi:spermidine synthase
MPKLPRKLYQYHGPQGVVSVVEEVDRGRRYLLFGDCVQGVISLSSDTALVLEYATVVMQLALLTSRGKHQRICFGGLGVGALQRSSESCWGPGFSGVTVELDPQILEVCQRYFPPVPGHLEVMDFSAYLRGDVGPFDLICHDCFSAEDMPDHLTTEPFLEDCRRALHPTQGRLLINSWRRQRNPRLPQLLKAVLQVFSSVGVYRCDRDGNLVLLAYVREPAKGAFPGFVLRGKAYGPQVYRLREQSGFPDWLKRECFPP